MIRHGSVVLISIIVILVFSIAMVVPVEYLPFDSSYDKLKHAAFFAFITLSVAACIRLVLWKIVTIVSLFAVLSEVAQHYIPYRSGNTEDLMADLAGVLVGSMLAKIVQLNSQRNKRSEP